MPPVESAQYQPPNSSIYRQWLTSQPISTSWARWLAMVVVAVPTGILAYLLGLGIELLTATKFRLLSGALLGVGPGAALALNAALCGGAAAVASLLVLVVAPGAAGSGLPEVIAHLNGCVLPGSFPLKAVGVTFSGCCLSLAAALPIGSEGPMIHIGAMIASNITRMGALPRWMRLPFMAHLANPRDQRDCMMAGAASGIAAAFSAPLGGLLFAIEEVCSFYSSELLPHTLAACVAAVLADLLCRSGARALTSGAPFGWFDGDVIFEAGGSLYSHVLALVPAAGIGVLAGVLGGALNLLALAIIRLRNRLLGKGPSWRRLVEAVGWALAFSALGLCLPLAWPCQPAPTQLSAPQLGGVMPSSSTPHTALPQGLWGGVVARASAALAPTRRATLELYSCAPEGGPGGSIHPGQEGGEGAGTYYNQLATLTLTSGEDALRKLLTRGTPHALGYPALAAYGALYFLGAAICCGTLLPAGMLVPLLIVGACLGRAVGLAVLDAATAAGIAVTEGGPWSWLQPGAFALVGAGALLCGSSRLTVAVAVLTMEVSNDVNQLPAILTAILAAKWAADATAPSLYHLLMEAKGLPYLPDPAALGPLARWLEVVPVARAMAAPVVTLAPAVTVEELWELMESNAHHAFPIVQGSPRTTTPHAAVPAADAAAAVAASGTSPQPQQQQHHHHHHQQAAAGAAAGGVFLGVVHRQPMEALLGLLLSDHLAALDSNDSSKEAATGPGRGLFVLPSGRRQQAAVGAVSSSFSMAADAAVAAAVGSGSGAPDVYGLLWSAEAAATYAAVQAAVAAGGRGVVPGAVWGARLALLPFMDTSAYKVQDSFSLGRAYTLFRTLGLRHLLVTDRHNTVVGVIARQDLTEGPLLRAVFEEVEACAAANPANGPSLPPQPPSRPQLPPNMPPLAAGAGPLLPPVAELGPGPDAFVRLGSMRGISQLAGQQLRWRGLRWQGEQQQWREDPQAGRAASAAGAAGWHPAPSNSSNSSTNNLQWRSHSAIVPSSAGVHSSNRSSNSNSRSSRLRPGADSSSTHGAREQRLRAAQPQEGSEEQAALVQPLLQGVVDVEVGEVAVVEEDNQHQGGTVTAAAAAAASVAVCLQGPSPSNRGTGSRGRAHANIRRLPRRLPAGVGAPLGRAMLEAALGSFISEAAPGLVGVASDPGPVSGPHGVTLAGGRGGAADEVGGPSEGLQ